MADSNKLQNFTGTHKCVHKHTTHRKNTITGWAVVAHTFSTQQAEAGRSLRVQDQAGLDRVSRQPGIHKENLPHQVVVAHAFNPSSWKTKSQNKTKNVCPRAWVVWYWGLHSRPPASSLPTRLDFQPQSGGLLH